MIFWGRGCWRTNDSTRSGLFELFDELCRERPDVGGLESAGQVAEGFELRLGGSLAIIDVEQAEFAIGCDARSGDGGFQPTTSEYDGYSQNGTPRLQFVYRPT